MFQPWHVIPIKENLHTPAWWYVSTFVAHLGEDADFNMTGSIVFPVQCVRTLLACTEHGYCPNQSPESNWPLNLLQCPTSLMFFRLYVSKTGSLVSGSKTCGKPWGMKTGIATYQCLLKWDVEQSNKGVKFSCAYIWPILQAILSYLTSDTWSRAVVLLHILWQINVKMSDTHVKQRQSVIMRFIDLEVSSAGCFSWLCLLCFTVCLFVFLI